MLKKKWNCTGFQLSPAALSAVTAATLQRSKLTIWGFESPPVDATTLRTPFDWCCNIQGVWVHSMTVHHTSYLGMLTFLPLQQPFLKTAASQRLCNNFFIKVWPHPCSTSDRWAFSLSCCATVLFDAFGSFEVERDPRFWFRHVETNWNFWATGVEHGSWFGSGPPSAVVWWQLHHQCPSLDYQFSLSLSDYHATLPMFGLQTDASFFFFPLLLCQMCSTSKK